MLIQRILQSAELEAPDLPGFPPNEVQKLFVGRSGRAALEEVIPFVKLIEDTKPLNNEMTVVDFGAGWGRFARFFKESVSRDNLYLADVDPGALVWCKRCRVKGIPVLLDKSGTLPLSDGSADVIYSYSVFSHLSGKAAVHWLNDIHRVLKPGGAFVFTTQSLRFLQTVYAFSKKWWPNDFERSMAKYMGPRPKDAIERYTRGEHTYSDVNGIGGGGVLSGDFYGWAAIPPAWIQTEFGSKFDIEQYVDDPAQFEQAVYVMRRL